MNSNQMAEQTIVREARTADLSELLDLAVRSFRDTFESDNDQSNIDEYLSSSITEVKLREELSDTNNQFLVACASDSGKLTGYAKLRTSSCHSSVVGNTAIEIQRIYADRSVIGKGIGAALMTMRRAQGCAIRTCWRVEAGFSRMDSDDLIRAYIDAWNRLDVAAILELMHPGAAYYDAFWAESCVGRDLGQYFRDSMDEEPFWYEKIGETITSEHGVAYRYRATQRSSPKPLEPIYGAEILSLRDGKILTITDIYCNPDRYALRELVTLSATHHGLTSHAQSGLGALKILRIRSNFSASLDIDRLYLDPNMTMTELAKRVNCTLDQLTAVVEKQFGRDLSEILDGHRVEHAKRLLQEDTVDPGILTRVAASAGFASVADFKRKFLEQVGVAPMEFVNENNPNLGNNGNSKLH